MSSADPIRAAFEEAQATLAAFLADPACLTGVAAFADAAEATLRRGGKLMSCGNGGSMCDAMHFAEEWTGRFRGDRDALTALAFSDPSHLTCIANDFGFDAIFRRQCEALVGPSDALVVFSTSGRSRNLVDALETARGRGATCIGFLGGDGGSCEPLCDVSFIAPGRDSAAIQEIHQFLMHACCEQFEPEPDTP